MITAVIRTVILYLFIIVGIRLLGKRQIGQLEPSELVLSLLIADLAAVPMLKELTHLPIIVDPSHAAGNSAWVTPLALAAAAVGADGLLVEVHDRPAVALSDGAQALNCEQFDELAQRVRALLPYAWKE